MTSRLVEKRKKEARVVKNKLGKEGVLLGALVALVFAGIGASWAQSLSTQGAVKAAKGRMMARLRIILKLKAEGVVGENNRGYLELLRDRGNKGYRDVVSDENRDRRIIYQYIARTQGVSLKAVGRLRAKQIRERAPSGHWLEDDSGNWYKKP